MIRERCPNDNHGRAIVTVRFCPDCGEIVNGKIPARRCSEEEHAMRRRARYTYCVDCGERLIQGR
jgi:rRNA maturation protein Nop10